MFKDFLVNIDQVRYDEETGTTQIFGWGISPKNKNKITIKSTAPALINQVPREDIKEIYGVDRDISYGFLLQFPGRPEEIDSELTFSDGSSIETVPLSSVLRSKKLDILSKAYKTLVDQGFLKLPFKLKQERKEEREQPKTPFSSWIEEEEPYLWADSSSQGTTRPITAIVTVKNNEKDLRKTIESLRKQSIPFNEILIAAIDDVVLDEDFELPVFRHDTISEAVNEAFEYIKSDYITFVDNGDILSPHFVSEINSYLREDPGTELIYADSDKIDETGERYELHFKPAYDPILLRSHNYILQPLVLSAELFDRIGGFRKNREGLQNYDLILRATKSANSVGHIPKILYHWQSVDQKISKDQKLSDEYELGTQILKETFDGQEFEVSEIDYVYDLKRDQTAPGVDIIIAKTEGDNEALVSETVRTLLEFTDYPNFKINAVNIEEKDTDVRYLMRPELKSKYEIYNEVSKDMNEEYLLFVDPGFKPVEPSWLSELISLAEQEEVGITGPKIFKENFQIDQAGITLNEDKREKIGQGQYCLSNGYDLRYRLPREVYAVGEECLLIGRDLFSAVGGFDLELNDNEKDIGLALSARDVGKKSVIHNNVPVRFLESKTDKKKEIQGLLKNFSKERLIDTIENPNITAGGTITKIVKEN